MNIENSKMMKLQNPGKLIEPDDIPEKNIQVALTVVNSYLTSFSSGDSELNIHQSTRLHKGIGDFVGVIDMNAKFHFLSIA